VLAEARKRPDLGLLHARPVVDDLGIVEVESLVTECGCRGIACQILVAHRLPLMVLPPIDLDDQPATHDEVHPADAIDVYLTCEHDSHQMKPQAEEGFETAAGIWPC